MAEFTYPTLQGLDAAIDRDGYVIVLGDSQPDQMVDMLRIDSLAFVRIHKDEGISGLSAIFTVPPEVARAVLDGPYSLFGARLIGEDPLRTALAKAL